MSTLSVQNKILRFKGISYQISQISSIKVVEIKLKKTKKVSLKPLMKLLPIIGGVYLYLTKVMNEFDIDENLSYFIMILGAISALFSVFIIIRKIREMNRDKYHVLYGLSLRMSNGDDPIFTTTNKNLIFDINDAVSESMNKDGESVSVNFDNVNIDITNSEKVEIGNVVTG